MRVKSLLVACGVILALSATAAFAGNKAGSVYVSPLVGGITYEGKQHLETSPVFGGRLGYNFTKALGIEALFDFTRTESTRTGNTLDFYRYGGELLYNFVPDNKLVPYLAAGYSAVNFIGNSTFATTEKAKGSPSYGIGAKYFVTDDIAWRFDVRHLMYRYDKQQHAVEYTIGLYIPLSGYAPATKLVEPPPPPPASPEPALVMPATPPPGPSVSLTATPASITKGQPSTLAWTSKNATSCDLQPGIGAVSTSGNTPVSPVENTTYTIVCKGAGGTATNTATVNLLIEAAKPKSAAVERFCNKPAIVDVKFDLNKTNIKPNYIKDLNVLGGFLVENPKAHGLIGGHTCTIGSKAYNQKLSEGRAASVKKYLVDKFKIDPARIETKGFNFSKPIATNKTAAGRAQNRRIETFFECE